MADSPEKRRREAQKRRKRELKAERKRLRKEGILGQDSSGLFAPGGPSRETLEGTSRSLAAPEGNPPDASPATDR